MTTHDPYLALKELGLELPPLPAPVANFVLAQREGQLLYLSGQGPRDPAGRIMLGKVGADFTAEQAYEHAKYVGLGLLSVIHHELGSLLRVRRVVKLLGMVNAVPDFTMHPQVINGCSDLFCRVFGTEIGRHARSAVGMGSLPANISVEIEAIVSVVD
jgi:enamine deaminase RidA (YjgF/YER057c/UK114 family)